MIGTRARGVSALLLAASVAAATLGPALAAYTPPPAPTPSPTILGINPFDPWPLCVPRTAPIQLGLTEIAHKPFNDRITDINFASKAMGMNEHVDVLLPIGYGSSPTTRYPVLYLLHGALGGYADWAQHQVEQIVGGLGMIVVMPNGGPDGGYSDWYGNELGFPGPVPAVESFNLLEVLPWIDSHYRTIAAQRGRYIAGLSMGGAGTMKYAAANPGMFAAAGEFSGAVDTDLPGWYGESNVTGDLTYIPTEGPPSHCTFGDPNVHQVIWEGNDPTYLAPNLAGMRLFLASGNGQPGPYDSRPAASDVVEGTVYQMNLAFEATLTIDHIPHTTVFYGPGTHSWPYWQRDLSQFLTWLGPLARPVAVPQSFSVRSERETFAAWGWSFVPHHPLREFTYLSDVGSSGLVATGSGTLGVTTAALYRAGATYIVAAGSTVQPVVAGKDGTIHFNVDLGPSHTAQQTNFAPDAAAGWRHVHVTIAPAR